MSEPRDEINEHEDVAKHFPNTSKLLQERTAKSESPSRHRDECDDVNGDLSDTEDPSTAYGDASKVTRLEHRLKEASIRREKMLEERKRHLAAAEASRKQKLQVVVQMRQKALEEFIAQSPELFAELKRVGILGANQSPEVLEHILVTDRRTCNVCRDDNALQQPMCPVHNKPHRRSLVVTAEKILKLIGNCRVNLVPPKQQIVSVDAEPAKPSTRRGISVLPHLFVLAFYNASLSPNDIDPLLHECAVHLVQMTRQIAHAVERTYSVEGHDGFVRELLGSFAKTWRQYSKIADTTVTDRKVSERQRPPSGGGDSPLNDLVESSTEAFVAVYVLLHSVKGKREGTSDDEMAALAEFLDILAARLRGVGGPAALEQAMSKARSRVRPASPPQDVTRPAQLSTSDLSVVVAPTTLTPPLTPEKAAAPRSNARGEAIPPPAPPLPHYATSSDTDRDSSVAPPNLIPFGPDLPPRWYIDAQGISRPPPAATAEALAKERREQLELRARTAFQAKLKIADGPSEAESELQSVTESMRNMAFERLAADLNQRPPVLDRLPLALTSVCDALVEALPKRLRSKIGREIRDVLDWSSVHRSVRHSEGHIGELMRYVIGRVAELGAPARAEGLHEKCNELQQRLQSREESVGVIVADVFRFMLDSIRQLRLDVASFTLAVISGELVAKAEEYHTEYIQECFPSPIQWTSTVAFFNHFLNAPQTIALCKTPQFSNSSVAVGETEQRMRGALFVGVIDLLRSANRCGETRWTLFPLEALVLEKQQIFQAANTVQQDTLRLMVIGTVSMLLQSKKIALPKLNPCLVEFDTKLRTEWLPAATSLAQLQDMIRSEMNAILANDDISSVPSVLSEGEANVLNGVVAKMADTCSSQYNTFENRIIQAVQQALLMDPREAQSIPVAQRPKTIGLPSESAFKTGVQLRSVLDYHWTVYRPYYVTLSTAVVPLVDESVSENTV